VCSDQQDRCMPLREAYRTITLLLSEKFQAARETGAVC